MKRFLATIILLSLTISAHSQQSNGFGPEEGQSIALGSQVTVDIFNRFDKAWSERDYETIKSYVAEEALMRFNNGTIVEGPKAFVKEIEKQYKEIEKTYGWGWETLSAFSIKGIGAKDPSVRNQIGEWVNAQFRGKDGSITMEWYQIHEGKIIYWYQANGKPMIE
jgi:hypothetical protein